MAGHTARPRLHRRAVLCGGTLLAAGAVAGGWVVGERALAARPNGAGAPSALTPPEALDAIRAGTLVLVDVRHPDEWAETGIAEGAVPIDMRRHDFVEAVTAARGGREVAIGVICARGVRSRRMAQRLAAAGIDGIVDVPEGMLGSRAGPGWLARDLPVVHDLPVVRP